MELAELRCPECERDDPEIVQIMELIVRETQPVEVYSDGSPWEHGSAEREVVDADRDAASYRCEDCGHATDDPADFLAPECDEDHTQD